jgi:hypothetical protein
VLPEDVRRLFIAEASGLKGVFGLVMVKPDNLNQGRRITLPHATSLAKRVASSIPAPASSSSSSSSPSSIPTLPSATSSPAPLSSALLSYASLVPRFLDFSSFCGGTGELVVVQGCIEPPLRVKGHKADQRLYLVIDGLGSSSSSRSKQKELKERRPRRGPSLTDEETPDSTFSGEARAFAHFYPHQWFLYHTGLYWFKFKLKIKFIV